MLDIRGNQTVVKALELGRGTPANKTGFLLA